MISFQHVSKHFATQPVLSDVSVQVNPREHVGIVGPNGAGKSTVFNLITGEMEPDKGDVVTPARSRIGYVHQQLNPHAVGETLLEYTENAVPELQTIQTEIHALEEQMHQKTTDNMTATLRRLGELQSRFEHLDGYTLKNRAERTLSGLGFPHETFAALFRSLSGGWQSRAELARVLVAEPDILLLDEPSNYLDIPAVEWLKGYLEEYHGTLLLISHDRYLLNSLTTVTIEVANARAERYPGNYDYYARERTQRYEQRLAAQKNQDRKREQIERFVERFRAKNTWSSQVQSRIKMLEKLEAVTLPLAVRTQGRIRLRPPPHSGTEVVRLEEAGLTYDGSRWVLRGIDLSIGRGEKIALVGYNGMGKTTLLRMLAGNLPPSEGKRVLGHKVAIGYQSQDFAETMDPASTVYYTVKSVAGDASEQEVRTLLGGFGFSGDAIEKTVAVLSGGEKIRLAFARLLMRPPNFLILDEPTTHLDIQAREALETALQDYQGTICLVSHDIDFVRQVATGIIAMTPPGIRRYAGGYDYYREKVSGQQSLVIGKTKDSSRKKNGAKPTNDQEPMTNDPSARPANDQEPMTNDRSKLPSPLATGHLPLDKKSLRRQRAAARQEIQDRTKDLKKEIFRTEKQIGVYEAERAKLLEQLSGDPTQLDYAGLSKRLKFIQEEIERYTRRWEQAALDLEKAMGDTTDDKP